jgi:hypothetical protein
VIRLLPIMLLLAAPWVYGGEPAPTLRDVLEAGDAAMAPKTPTAAPDIDEREAALRDLEYRIDRMQASRRMIPEALAGMAANPDMKPELRKMACEALVKVMHAPDFSELVRGKLKPLEKPKNFARLTPEQVERLNRVKTAIDAMEAEPRLDCTKY